MSWLPWDTKLRLFWESPSPPVSLPKVVCRAGGRGVGLTWALGLFWQHPCCLGLWLLAHLLCVVLALDAEFWGRQPHGPISGPGMIPGSSDHPVLADVTPPVLLASTLSASIWPPWCYLTLLCQATGRVSSSQLSVQTTKKWMKARNNSSCLVEGSWLPRPGKTRAGLYTQGNQRRKLN